MDSLRDMVWAYLHVWIMWFIQFGLRDGLLCNLDLSVDFNVCIIRTAIAKVTKII